MSMPPGTKPLQTTYPKEFIDRVKSVLPGCGRLHTALTWNMGDVDRLFEYELIEAEHTAEELGVIRQLYDEARRLDQAARDPFPEHASAAG